MGEYYPVAIPRQTAPERSATANSIRRQVIDLSIARNNPQELIVKGNAIYLIDGTNPTSTITVQFNDQAGTGIALRRGHMFAGVEFSRLYITNAAQAGETLTLITLVEGERDFRALNADVNLTTITSITNTVDVASRGTVFDAHQATIPNATSTAILPADTTRRSVMIKNIHATATLYIDTTPASATSWPLLPGECLVLDQSATAAIYGYQASGGNMAVQYLRELD